MRSRLALIYKERRLLVKIDFKDVMILWLLR